MKKKTKILLSVRVPESTWLAIESHSKAEPKIRSGKISAGMHLESFTKRAVKALISQDIEDRLL